MRNSDSSQLHLAAARVAAIRPIFLALASAAVPGMLLFLLLVAPTNAWVGSSFWTAAVVIAALLTVLIAIFTLHYFSQIQAARENAELARKLSLMQNVTRQVMLEFNQQTVVRTACQTAMAISQADKAALFLRQGQELVLTGSAGVPAVHLMTRPYEPESWNGGDLRIVNDTAALTTDVPSGEFRAFAEIPLQENGRFLGHLTVYHHQPHDFTETERRLFNILGSQVFAALNLNEVSNQRLQREVQWQFEQLALMEGIIQQISGGQDFNEVISRVLDMAARTTGADMAALAMVTEADDLWVILHEYENGHTRKYQQSQAKSAGIIGYTIESGKTQLIQNNQQFGHYLPSVTQSYQSSLCVPLQRDDQIIGALEVESHQTGFFTEEQAIFLKNLGAHATITVYNTRLLEELQHQIGTLTSLRELTLKLSSAVETDTVAKAILETALHILQAQYAVLFHYDEAFKKLNWLNSLELAAPPQPEEIVTILRQTAYQAVHDGEIQILERESLHNFQFSILAVPIKRGGQVREVLCLVFTDQQQFLARDLNTLSLLAIQAAGHLENAALHEKIRQGNERMEAILDSTRDGIILLNENGQLIEANPAAARLLGINFSERLGEDYYAVLLRAIRQGETGFAGYLRDELVNLARVPFPEFDRITRRQFERRMPQSQVIYLEETASPVISKTNRVSGRLLSLRDISEEKQLESYRDEITNMVIHNLRGPLGSVLKGVELTREQIPNIQNYPVAVLLLERSVENIKRLLNMVSSLMEIAKLEARELKLQYGVMTVTDLLRNAYQDLQVSIEQAQITAEVLIAPDLPLVYVDGEKIHRVLTNLLDNALKFTPSEGKIQLSAVLDHRNRVLVRVADSGPGIPEAEREHLFEKYRQVKDNQPLRGSKGTGLGLTFCKLVIEAHDQNIWVEVPGPLPGACFAFTLPVA